jgi:hypothetical protein
VAPKRTRIHTAIVVAAAVASLASGSASAADAPGAQHFSMPSGYAIGEFLLPTSDGNQWTLLYKSNGDTTLFRVSAAGQFTPFALPAGYRGHGAIRQTPDGNLWFASTHTDPAGPGGQTATLVRATQAGEVQPYPISDHSNPVDPAVGAGGDLWFGDTGYQRNDITMAPAIGRFHLSGPNQYQTDWFALPGNFDAASSFFTGPDGNAWFVLQR